MSISTPGCKVADRKAPADERPSYAAQFHCIGPDCEDTCCRGWQIPLDKATFERYRQFPAEKLGAVVAQYVTISPHAPESMHARIQQTDDGFCAFFSVERLCRIQQDYGAGMLSATCSIYPRVLNTVEGVLEGSLSLSCPEAARNVLLSPNFMQSAGDLRSGAFRTDNAFHLAGDRDGAGHKPYGHFRDVRRVSMNAVRDRSRPLWERLLWIGWLCQRLDEVVSVEMDGQVPLILREFSESFASDALREEFAAMPANVKLKLEVAMRLTSERVSDKSSGVRFQDDYWTFIEGIGSADAASSGDDLRRYREAEEKYYRSFLDKYPFIMENYLQNYMLQTLFPFGRAGSPHFRPQGMFEEYILMATQFAWIETLLVGIAARHREDFSGAHVVHAVQSFTRAVEHYPSVLASINEYIRERGLHTLPGVAVLLK